MSKKDIDAEKEQERALKRAAKSYTNELVPGIIRPGNTVLVAWQEFLNKFFPPKLNPMYFIGAISLFLIWVLVVTGTYLFLFYEMNPEGAYKSVEYITKDQQYYGGIIRSVHRYAADALAISVLLHILQVFFSDRFRLSRWVAWVSGAVMLFWVWFEGITGYVLVWDEKGRMVAMEFARLLDVLPISVEPLSMLFNTNDRVTPVIFFVTNYLHLLIPCFLLILAWIHYMRISRPLISPPRPVAVTITLALIALSIIKPAVSAGPADLTKLIGEVEVDWFYLLPFPFVDWLGVSAAWVWAFGFVAFVIFVSMPWIIPGPKLKAKPVGEKPSVQKKKNKRLQRR